MTFLLPNIKEKKMLKINEIYCMDCLGGMQELPDNSVDLVVTSPPYWGLRDYGEDAVTIWGGDASCEHEFIEYTRPSGGGHPSESAKVGTTKKDVQRVYESKAAICSHCNAWKGQLGLEPHPQQYLEHLWQICDEIKRVLKKSGSVYWNLGDTYCGYWGNKNGEGTEYGNIPVHGHNQNKRGKLGKIIDGGWIQPKQLMLIPSRFAIGMQERGWILRNDIIWRKPNSMPSSVKDRLNTTYEHIFHFVKSRRYYYDLDAIRKPFRSEDTSPRKSGTIPNHKDRTRGQGREFFGNPKGKNPGDVCTHNKFSIGDGYRQGMNRDEYEILEIRIDLPPQEIFVKYLQPKTKSHEKKLDKAFGEHKWRHWIRYDESGFSYPSVEAWKNLKKLLALDDTFDLTKVQLKRNAVFSSSKGRNPGDVMDINTQPFPDAHFAVYPEKLIENFIKSSSPEEGIVLDPFIGSGTTAIVARKLLRNYIGFEINKEYIKLIQNRAAKIPQRLEAFNDA